jgi:hypothetical protein
MPQPSAFEPCGFLSFSSEPSRAERIYKAIRRSYGPAYDNETFDGPMSGRWYAKAMTLAEVRSTLERAANQADPRKAYDLLLAHERDYGLTPEPGDTLHDRREALAAAMLLAVGPRDANVRYQLQTLLGDDFVSWVTTPAGPDTAFPAQPWLTQGIFKNPALWKTIRITPSVAHTGVPKTVGWTHEAGDTGTIVVGDKLVVSPGDYGQQELITVTARTDTTLTTTFARPHEAGAVAIRRPWPFWMSTAKHSLVVVKNGRARDRALRKKTHQLLHKLLGGTSTWDIVEENASPGSSGPFLPGDGEPGINPIQQASF